MKRKLKNTEMRESHVAAGGSNRSGRNSYRVTAPFKPFSIFTADSPEHLDMPLAIFQIAGWVILASFASLFWLPAIDIARSIGVISANYYFCY